MVPLDPVPSCPAELSPQQYALPVAVNPQVWKPPPVSVVKTARSEVGDAVDVEVGFKVVVEVGDAFDVEVGVATGVDVPLAAAVAVWVPIRLSWPATRDGATWYPTVPSPSWPLSRDPQQ